MYNRNKKKQKKESTNHIYTTIRKEINRDKNKFYTTNINQLKWWREKERKKETNKGKKRLTE